MIGYIKGKVLSKNDRSAVILTSGGVGYRVYLTGPSLGGALVGEECSFFIHPQIREDAFNLFGFSTERDMELFLLLIDVNKVGPRLALATLSAASAGEIVGAIVSNDPTFFKNIPGIGKKTAEKIIIELKDKVESIGFDVSAPSVNVDSITAHHIQEAESGLLALGYTKSQIRRAIGKIDMKEGMRPEEIVRSALKIINEK